MPRTSPPLTRPISDGFDLCATGCRPKMCECGERLVQARFELGQQWGSGRLVVPKLRGLLTDPHDEQLTKDGS